MPLFAGYILWRRRDQIKADDFRPSWWGVGIVTVSFGVRYAGFALYQTWLDAASLLVAIVGIVVAIGGRRVLLWAAPGLLFLLFVIPLPYRIQSMLAGTLQRTATIASTYVLQTVGVPAVSEGNIILLTHDRLGIVEACNGLTMLVTFFALATAVALLVKRSFVERLLIVASAVPIAVAANVARISLTGVLFEAQQGDWAHRLFHDLAGWFMMPLAIGMLLVELYILKKSLVDVSAEPAG